MQLEKRKQFEIELDRKERIKLFPICRLYNYISWKPQKWMVNHYRKKEI